MSRIRQQTGLRRFTVVIILSAESGLGKDLFYVVPSQDHLFEVQQQIRGAPTGRSMHRSFFEEASSSHGDRVFGATEGGESKWRRLTGKSHKGMWLLT